MIIHFNYHVRHVDSKAGFLMNKNKKNLTEQILYLAKNISRKTNLYLMKYYFISHFAFNCN